MTKQTKFFEDDSIFLLEEQINKFLKTLHWSSEVIDIEYHHSGIRLADSSNMYERWDSVYTAMVIYKEPREDDSVTEGEGAEPV